MRIPAGFAQVNFRFTGTAAPTGAEMTFGVELLDGGMDPTDVGARAVDAWVTAGFQQFQSDQISLTQALCKFGPNDTGPSAEVAVTRPGTDTGSPVSPNVSVLLQKRTALGGRRGRGRCYLPGVPESQILGDGSLVGAWFDDLVDSCTAFVVDLALGDIPMVLLHAEDSGVITPNTVTSFAPSSTAATQRRRLRR